MPVNSFAYLLAFVPLVAVGTLVLHRRLGASAARNGLLAASLAFYAFDDARQLPLLLLSITGNWWCARAITTREVNSGPRRRLLQAGLAGNVALLATYKYVPVVFAAPALGTTLGFPLGLSFFTLAQVMYLVDVYEGLVPAGGWRDHAVFVSFFPNVTAGPLLRRRLFDRELPSLATGLPAERVSSALLLIALGLSKKVVLGDSFAAVATAGYARAGTLTAPEAWLAALAGTFEMYFDFAGYSDMALGVGGLLGLSLVRNFNAPFTAPHISDFWKRWHISLSDFITTYLYTPLLRAMGKATVHTAAIASLVAMLIAGVWHGAAWKYVVFGALHGGALGAYQYWKRRKRPLPRGLDVAVTFAFVHLAFMTVRAPDLGVAGAMLADMAGRGGDGGLWSAISVGDWRMLAGPLVAGSLLAFVGPTADTIAARARPMVRSDLTVFGLLVLSYFYMGSRAVTEFRYRQF